MIRNFGIQFTGLTTVHIEKNANLPPTAINRIILMESVHTECLGSGKGTTYEISTILVRLNTRGSLGDRSSSIDTLHNALTKSTIASLLSL